MESKLCGVRDNFAVGGRRNALGRRLRTQEDSRERHVDEETAMTLFVAIKYSYKINLAIALVNMKPPSAGWQAAANYSRAKGTKISEVLTLNLEQNKDCGWPCACWAPWRCC